MKRGRKPKCPYCRASDNIAKGHRRTATMGLRSLRVCKGCGRKFTVGKTPLIVARPAPQQPPAAPVVAAPLVP